MLKKKKKCISLLQEIVMLCIELMVMNICSLCFKGLLAHRREEEVQKFNYCVHPTAILLPSAISLKGDFKSSAAPLL